MLRLRQVVGRAIKASSFAWGRAATPRSFGVRVRKLLSVSGGVAVALTALVLSVGCSTVIVPEKRAAERAAVMERAALVEAANELSQTKWPKPDSASWGARLTGFIGSGDRVSENEAAEAYLTLLQTKADPASALFSDASYQLAAADDLIEAAAVAAASMRPAMADVSVMEKAISDLRETRDIYISCLKTLDDEGARVDEDAVRQLKTDFNLAIEAVGVAADSLAESAARIDAKTFAKPESRRNFRSAL